MAKQVSIAFNPHRVVCRSQPSCQFKQAKTVVRSSQKYQQVLSSVREVGTIEPLIVFPRPQTAILLLDGDVPLEVPAGK
jgi:ParB-like chromosome segregation protein Spo0J